MNARIKHTGPVFSSEWLLISISWFTYLGGLLFFARANSYWALMALGALPVVVTAWSLGKVFGIGAATLSILIHILLDITWVGISGSLKVFLFNHLVGFSLLAVAGILIGHLRDLQIKSRSELASLYKNNKKLIQLAKALETTTQLTIDIMASQEWLEKIPDLLKNISQTAGIDHILTLRLSGDGSENCSGEIQHYWSAGEGKNTKRVLAVLPPELLSWIQAARNGTQLINSLLETSPELIDCFSLGNQGEFALYPLFTNVAVWGLIGFENNQFENPWSSPELNTFKNISQSLGSVIYYKLIEENLTLRARELDSLQKASSNIASSDQLDSGLRIVLCQVFELTPAYDSSIFLCRNNQLEYYFSLSNNKQQSLPFTHVGDLEIAQMVAKTNQDLFIPDISLFDSYPFEAANQEEGLISFSLKAASEVIGILNIWYAGAHNFTEQEKTILRLLADQAASAIINAQYIQAERKQRNLSDSLRKANLLLSNNLDLKQVLDSILQQVLLLAAARDCHIYLYDGETLKFGAVMCSADVPSEPVQLPEKGSLYYRAAQTCERILVPDILAEKTIQGSWKTGSLICLPLIFHKKVIGIMNVTFFEPGDLSEQMLQTLDLLSNQAAIAINNARTFEAERDQRKLAQALQHTGRAIQSSLDLEVVLDQILTQISNVIPYHSANLILIDNGNARVVRQQGFQQGTTDEDSPGEIQPFDITGFSTLVTMIETKKPLIIPDTRAHPDWVKTKSTEKILSWAGAPILNGDQVIGFLSLNHQTQNYYSPEHEDTLSAFASQAAIALAHASLHKEIQDLAVTDPLTLIYNRRGLNRWGQYEIERARRFNSPLSAIFFDLDHFKQVNDEFGHDCGDDVLQQVVSCCQTVIRKIDIFSRIGGEEFLIILPETNLPVAIEVAERVRNTISEHIFQVNSHQIQITISLGVVELTGEIEDLADLINQADQYMYQSKQSGRNKTSSQRLKLA